MNTMTRLRLLLVEDEPTQQLLLERLLEQAGYSVATASTGDAALDMIATGQYQILLTDWDMPGMDGVTLCRRVREIDLPTYLYVLLLTGNTSTQHVVAGLEAGADDYLRKPADEAELLARLSAGQRIVRLEQSLREANARIQQMSITDPLTGVFNRRHLSEQLLVDIERAHRHSRSLALVMADLDHFKQINDRHGHQVGDEVLHGFAERMRASIRPSSDWIARYGGEEFVLVLNESDLDAGSATAERVRLLCAGRPFETAAGALSVTASFGVAALDHSVPAREALETLLREADAALYRSKGGGRNRVTPATRARRTVRGAQKTA